MAADRAKLLGSGQLAEESADARRQDRALRVRAFFGLPLPEEHRSHLQRYIEECAALAPQFRWTLDEKLHITIRFLGHLEQAVAESIAARVEEAELPGFELELGEVGTFKRGRLARVVWIGLSAGESQCSALASAVEAECVRAGLEAESRRFHPHLTLARARLRDGARLPDLPAPTGLKAWRASELILYRSHLGRGGSVYEALRMIRLR
jgi:RNA 2',3'-cyclic 3'-phosphodiesterase